AAAPAGSSSGRRTRAARTWRPTSPRCWTCICASAAAKPRRWRARPPWSAPHSRRRRPQCASACRSSTSPRWSGCSTSGASPSAAAVSLEYDIAIRAPRVARPVGVLKAVFALDRLSRLLAAADLPGGVRLEVVDAQGRRIVTPDSTDLLRPLPQAADIPRLSRPAMARLPGPGGPGGSADLVVTVPTADGKWWVVFREPESAAYAVARPTATNIVLWTVALFGAALTLLVVFWPRLNRRVTAPGDAAGGDASRVAG